MKILNFEKGVYVKGHNYAMGEEVFVEIGNHLFRCAAYTKETLKDGTKTQLIKSIKL